MSNIIDLEAEKKNRWPIVRYMVDGKPVEVRVDPKKIEYGLGLLFHPISTSDPDGAA